MANACGYEEIKVLIAYYARYGGDRGAGAREYRGREAEEERAGRGFKKTGFIY